MSEIIEINEDNCVLNEIEMLNLKNGIAYMLSHGDKEALEPLKRILQKITKLNDLAKEQER